MATMDSTRCFARSANLRRLLGVGILAITAGICVHGERARACGYDPPDISDETTFDPVLVGGWTGLAYDPYDETFGGACESCLDKSMMADWTGYLPGVTAADWKPVLYRASSAELGTLRARASGRGKVPRAYRTSSLWKAPRKHLTAALDLVRLARDVEPHATFELNRNGVRAGRPPADLLARARGGLAAARKTRDAFLAQRYGFQLLRIAFYQRDWPAVVAFYDRNPKIVGGPSVDLAWRAHHYLAGALLHEGHRARANLELARIATHYQPLAGLAVLEFKPLEDADWRATLAMAQTPREKTELWQMAGIKKDPLAAVYEILRLDPRSDLIGLLLVRELTHTEHQSSYSAKNAKANRKTLAAIERIALGQIARNGDRPWLMRLIAGHVAALRGDLAAARSRLEAAVAARPGDTAVANQAKASMAIALAMRWRFGNRAAGDELAASMSSLGPKFSRRNTVRRVVRAQLAKTLVASGRLVDAEFLVPGSADPWDDKNNRPKNGRYHWSQRWFIQQMIARANRRATAFDRFVLDGSYTHDQLRLELALRLVFEGRFAAAQRALPSSTPKLGTDPFVMHIRDCHDCDHTTYAAAPWTTTTVIARLVALEAKVRRGGEAGAAAALEIGNAMYNLTYWGNARIATENTHQHTRDASQAIRWYKRAFDLTRDRELETKAAFFAAKAELGTELYQAVGDASSWKLESTKLPIPRIWFPVVKRFANTRYYKEILSECGHFAAWAK